MHTYIDGATVVAPTSVPEIENVIGTAGSAIANAQSIQSSEIVGLGKMNGKPVLYRDAKTVLNMNSAFAHKLLCTGPVLNLGDACGFSCTYCYVEDAMRKLIHTQLGGHEHQDVVMRRQNALKILQSQLSKNKHKTTPNVVYSSALVDIAANLGLMKESAEACRIILEQTVWDIRLLTKSNLLPKLVALIPEKFKTRLILGVSTGTFDEGLGKVIEKGTAPISMRVASLHWLQDNGYRTFAMVCPSLPQNDYVAFAKKAAELLRYDQCEHVWTEVINVRGESFAQTIAALDAAGFIIERDNLAKVCGSDSKKNWEAYARATFEAHAEIVPKGKLRHLQYVERKENLPYWKGKETHGAIILGRQRNKAVESHPAPLPAVEGTSDIRHLLQANKDLESKFKKRQLSTIGLWTENTIKVGEFFSRQKEKLPHGQYITWVVSNFAIDRKTANNYVAVYTHRELVRDAIKRGTVPHLTAAYKMVRKANRLLKTSEEEREQAAETQVQQERDFLPEVQLPNEITPLPNGHNDNINAELPVLVVSAPEEVIAELLELVKQYTARYPHQIIREDGDVRLNEYFSKRLELIAA